MPLARFQLRNEYGLGVRELYRESSEREDPKAVLDGVAVAGLVGLLRQLGDLAGFASQVFHGLREEVTTTASRSRKLMIRVKRIEAALPPIEKAMLSQTSHIHFAYAPGSNWHARNRNEENHFLYADLPQCIMDVYEECREPPRLQLLDKFDTGGPGSCLKRYSDPTFFRGVSGNSDTLNDEKYHKWRKARKVKKRRSRKRSSQLPSNASNFDSSDRLQFSSRSRPRQASPSHTLSTYDMAFKSELVDQSGSTGSGDGMGFIECVFHPSALLQPDETKITKSLSGSDDKTMNTLESNYSEEQTALRDIPGSSILEKDTHLSSNVNWDEEVETVEHVALNSQTQEDPSLHETSFEFDKQEIEATVWKSVDDEVAKVNETNFECDEPDIKPMGWNSRSYEVTEAHETIVQLDDLDNEPSGHTSESDGISEVYESNFERDELGVEPLGLNSRVNQISEVYKTDLEHDEQEMAPEMQEMAPEVQETVDVVGTSFDGTESPNVIFDKNQPDDIESETDDFVDALNTIESESVKDLDYQAKRYVDSYDKGDVVDDVDNKMIACNIENHPLELKSPSRSYNDLNQPNFNVSHDSTSSPLSTCEEPLQHAPASLDTTGAEVCGNSDMVDDVDNKMIACNIENHLLESVSPSMSYNDLNQPNFNVSHDSTSSLLSTCEEPLQHAPASLDTPVAEVYGNSDMVDDVDNKMIACNIENHPLESESPSMSYNDLNQPNFNVSHGSTSTLLSTCEEPLQHAPASLDTPGAEVCGNSDMVDDVGNKMIACNIENHPLELKSPSRSYNDLNQPNFNVSHDSTSSLLSLLSSCEEPLQHAPASLDTPGAEVCGNSDMVDDVDNKMIASNIENHLLESESPSMSCNDLNQPNFNVSHDSASLLSTCEEPLQRAPASLDTPGAELCGNFDDLVSPVHLADDAPLQSIPSSSVQNISYEIHDNADGVKQESNFGELSSVVKATSVMAGTYEGTIHQLLSQQGPVESSNISSVALWTNGGLLGLQPSKPPDFNTSNSPDINTGITVPPPYQNLMAKDNNFQGKFDLPLKHFGHDDRNANSEELTLGSDNQEIGSTKALPSQFSNSGLDGELMKSIESNQSYLLPSTMPPETKNPGFADARTTSNEKVNMSEDQSFLSGLGRSLLMNGFRRTRSLDYDEKPKAVTSSRIHDFENGPGGISNHSFKGTDLKKELTSPVNSPPSSPPLEHMKISFQPINSFETSKLRLKYPEGIEHQEENINAFPSFQLVPEPNHLQHDVVSDSDDDSFCRSNLCISDDDLSHLSDSVWEFGDSSESREDMPYDGLHRISNGESITSSCEHEELKNRRMHDDFESSKLNYSMGLRHSSSSNISDIPVLHAMNPFPYQKTKISPKQDELMEPFDMRELTPELPPFPPVQWMVSKPHSGSVEGNESTPTSYLTSSSNSMNPGSAFPHLAKPEPDKLNDPKAENVNIIMRNEAADERVESGGDFLHQIRTKSFNLRKAGLLKPTSASTASTTHDNVTAIMQKANAIRQAVASDDGEDTDPWSDT